MIAYTYSWGESTSYTFTEEVEAIWMKIALKLKGHKAHRYGKSVITHNKAPIREILNHIGVPSP